MRDYNRMAELFLVRHRPCVCQPTPRQLRSIVGAHAAPVTRRSGDKIAGGGRWPQWPQLDEKAQAMAQLVEKWPRMN